MKVCTLTTLFLCVAATFWFAVLSPVESTHLKYTGVTESGLEFGYAVNGIGSGPATCQPTAASCAYMLTNKLNHVRIPFRWERVQPQLNGPLDPIEFGKVTLAVETAFQSGLQYVLVDVHNYADYAGSPIGSNAVPISAFSNLWSQLAPHFNNTNIVLGLMNEPVGTQSAGQGGGTMTTETWLSAVNAAIAAIRAQGNTNLITVPGLGYTGAHAWSNNPAYYGTSNSLVMQNVVDPLNNYVYEIHQYLDSSTGFAGTATDCVDGPTIIAQFAGVVQWATTYNKQLWLGEFAAFNSPMCQSSITSLLLYMEQNTNIFVGWTWWAAGPCWGNYLFSIEPSSPNPQIAWLSPFGALSTVAEPTPGIVTAAPTTTGTGTALTPALSFVSPPLSAVSTSVITVTAQYTASVPSQIVINLLQLPTYAYFGGASAAVNTGSGTVTVYITITAGAPPSSSYTLDAFIVSQTVYAAGTNPIAYQSAFIDIKSPITLTPPTTSTTASPSTSTTAFTSTSTTVSTPTSTSTFTTAPTSTSTVTTSPTSTTASTTLPATTIPTSASITTTTPTSTSATTTASTLTTSQATSLVTTSAPTSAPTTSTAAHVDVIIAITFTVSLSGSSATASFSVLSASILLSLSSALGVTSSRLIVVSIIISATGQHLQGASAGAGAGATGTVGATVNLMVVPSTVSGGVSANSLASTIVSTAADGTSPVGSALASAGVAVTATPTMQVVAPTPAPQSTSSTSSSNAALIVGLCVGLGVALIVIVAVVLVVTKRKSTAQTERSNTNIAMSNSV